MAIKPILRDPKEVLRDLFDKDKINLVCEKHNYVAGGYRKHTGCQRCIFVDFIALIARTPKDKQHEALEQFEGLVHAMCELEDKGKLSVNLQRHPTIHVEHVPDGDDECLTN